MYIFITCALTCYSLNAGNYQAQIDQAIADANQPEVDNGQSTLFSCQGGDEGVITFIKACTVGQCVDAGRGKSDFCA